MKISVGELRKLVEQAINEAEPVSGKKPKLTPAQKRREQQRQELLAYQRAEREKHERENPMLPEYEGLKPGQWIKLNDGTVVQLKRIQRRKGPPGYDDYVYAEVHTTFGHDTGQRADLLLKGAVPATPEEVADVQERGRKHSEWMSTQIDTSREGT